MKDRIKEILEDHRGIDDLDYIAGLIEHRIKEGEADKTNAQKISEHKIDGIEYSEFAHLTTDHKDEVRYDGDGKQLEHKKVKSYGFFKNEYYDD